MRDLPWGDAEWDNEWKQQARGILDWPQADLFGVRRKVCRRDLRQLLWHRHRLVQMRTRIMNQLQAVAMNEGIRRKKALWSKTGRTQLAAVGGVKLSV